MPSPSQRAQSRPRRKARRSRDKANATNLKQKVEAFVESEGPWTAHDITLAPGVQTLGAEVGDSRLRRVVQVAADITGKPLDKLRVLDLGCLEGQFGIEFAMHGAEVLAIEVRETNVRKTRFAAEALGLQTIEIRQLDVRQLPAASLGNFDVVLCLGMLYHLDAPDVMELVRFMSGLCSEIVIIDTHVSLEPRASVDWDGQHYWGSYWTEYAAARRAEEQDAALWSSFGNDRSFLLTRASLCNLLRREGFTSVYECLNPYECHSPDWPLASKSGECVEWPDRTTFVAVKGTRPGILSSSLTDSAPEEDRPERPRYLQPIIPEGGPLIARVRRMMGAAIGKLRRLR